MGVAGARIPPEFTEQFERLGEPVVIHRLTRFDDPAWCRAARDWLAEREAMRHGEELVVERRERRRTAVYVAAMALAWVAILSTLLLQ